MWDLAPSDPWDEAENELCALPSPQFTSTAHGPSLAPGSEKDPRANEVEDPSFEFWSDDLRSLIRRGVGLWLYRPLPGGMVEFSTSYTYEVRWGLFGRLLDRLAFRPFFQAETERSFRRLDARWFPDGASPVLGASGRKPARF